MSEPTPRENREQVVALARGEQGEQGARGERGERGLPVAQRRAIVYLFVLNLLVVGACFVGLYHYVRSNETERCTSIEQVTRIPVPHPVAGNPSREWESKYESIEQARGRQLGCR